MSGAAYMRAAPTVGVERRELFSGDQGESRASIKMRVWRRWAT